MDILVITIKRILVGLTDIQLEELDRLVKERGYSNRAEAVREAVLLLIERKKIEELQKGTR